MSEKDTSPKPSNTTDPAAMSKGTGRKLNDEERARFAARILDADVPPGYLEERTAAYLQESKSEDESADSIVVFRIGAEWFALSTNSFQEVAPLRAVHALPHRRNKVVAGVANVRGSLLVVVSLAALFGISGGGSSASSKDGRVGPPLMMVLKGKGRSIVCPVDEVRGVQRYQASQVRDVPATLSKTASSHAKAALSWEGETIDLLDEELLFNSITRSLA
ncbi:MAG: chemotaxis protein CheW [Synoicihabitans sp.]